tara:strand:+ start:310 stop:1095 length:786 start_codon:yes stop_codon:yes gene_type:complete
MNEYEMSKRVSRRNLLTSYTPPNSPISNQINNQDNRSNNEPIYENIESNDENHSIWWKITNIYKNRKKNNSLRIPLHLILHVTLLSIFEILLFFNFVVVMEKNAFIDKLEEYFKNSQTFSINPYLIPYINTELNSDKSDEWFNSLENKKDNSFNDYYNYNNSLKKYAWKGTFLLAGIFLFYIFTLFMFYKLSLKKLILEHIILISLIGIYEYWFFTNIILPYKIISSDELNYIIVSCLVKKLNTYDGIYVNATITDSCNLI